jgi:hypothetical protein
MMNRVARVRDKIGYAVIAACAVAAVVRTSTSKPFHEPRPITPQLARLAWSELTNKEPSERREAAHRFPGDAWSADDDYHEHEQSAARGFAGNHDVSLTAVLDALDQGMREKWPTLAPIDPKVPPCRPRLTY